MDFWRLKRISVFGNSRISAEELTHKTLEFFGGYYFWLIPKNEVMFVSPQKAEDYLRSNFPAIESLKIKRDFPDGLIVSIKERGIKSIYCAPRGESCAYVDSLGYVFAPAPVYSEGVYLMITSNASDSPIVAKNFQGFELLPEGIYNRLVRFRENLALLGIAIDRVELSNTDVYRAYSPKGWSAIIQKNIDPDHAAKNMAVLLKEKVKDRESSLDYVDLRFGAKIFYKFKE